MPAPFTLPELLATPSPDQLRARFLAYLGGPSLSPGGGGGGGGSSAIPVPPGLSTLVDWIDGQDIDLLGNSSLADGQPLSFWKSKGSLGSAADRANATIAEQPTFRLIASAGKLGNLSGVEFNDVHSLTSGNVTLMNAPFKQAGIVLRVASGGDVYWDGNDGTNRAAFFSVGSWTMYAGSALSAGSPVDNTFNMANLLWNGASSVIRINGAQIATGDPGAAKIDGFREGLGGDSTSGLRGMLIERLTWYGGAFPTDAAIEAYFTAKYGSFPQ